MNSPLTQDSVKENEEIVQRINKLVEEICTVYKNRKISSKTFNDLYFASCCYQTIKIDLEYLFRIYISFETKSKMLYMESFKSRREEEIEKYAFKLEKHFSKSLMILKDILKYQERAIKQNFNASEMSEKYISLRKKAKVLKNKIHFIVNSWQKNFEIDIYVKDPNYKLTKFCPKNYFLPSKPSAEYLSKFFIKLNDHYLRKKVSERDLISMYRIFIDYKNSGEDIVGLLSKYFDTRIKEDKVRNFLYTSILNTVHDPECKFTKIGPFDIKIISSLEVNRIFYFDTNENQEVDKECFIILNDGINEIFLSSSKISIIKFRRKEKERLEVPQSAKYFCYIYPCMKNKPVTSETLEYFKYYGGFLFFNQALDRVVHACGLNDLKGRYNKNEHTKPIFFSYPFHVRPSALKETRLALRRCTFSAVSEIKMECEKYAWLRPGELGFQNFGGFIFKNKEGYYFLFHFIEKGVGQIVNEYREQKELRMRWKDRIPTYIQQSQP